jgi:hypothetical protein
MIQIYKERGNKLGLFYVIRNGTVSYMFSSFTVRLLTLKQIAMNR